MKFYAMNLINYTIFQNANASSDYSKNTYLRRMKYIQLWDERTFVHSEIIHLQGIYYSTNYVTIALWVGYTIMYDT